MNIHRSEDVGQRAPQQDRSRRNQEKLLQAGRKLLATVNLDVLKVEDICEAAGLTTGAFYRRFVGKEAYFNALQEACFSDAFVGKARLARGEHQSFEQNLDAYHQRAIGWMRAHQGVLRAVMHRMSGLPGGDNPFVHARRGSDKFLRQTAFAHYRVAPSPEAERVVSSANQLLFGMLSAMLITDPGPYRLTDPDLPERLTRIMIVYLDAFLKPMGETGR
ncbi:MAG: TetR/AcrR family transcriptional regulator [Hyphomicrobiales bacterium]|nr:TetR/AcrR family transcriptional regulator [Hyphomicrobiales bacterium]